MAAGLTIEAKWTERDLERWRGDALEKAIVRAIRNAGDRAARRMLTDGVKFIQSKKRLKESFLRSQIKLFRPGKSAKLDDLVWSIRVSGKAVPLAMYPAVRTTRTGVTVRVNVGKAQKVAHAFLATMPSGHEGIYLRKTKHRLPIKELYSTKLTDVIQDEGAVDAIFAPAKEALTAAFDEAVASFAR
jgi:acetylglutamate kinase